MLRTDTGPLWNRVGMILAEDSNYPIEGTFLYAEVEPGVVSASVFKEVEHYLLYRIAPDGITDLLLELMAAEPVGKRWEIVEYVIRGGRFKARFTYPEEIDRAEDPLDRRTRILKERFPGKRIVYPTWDEVRAQQRAIEAGLPPPRTLIPPEA